MNVYKNMTRITFASLADQIATEYQKTQHADPSKKHSTWTVGADLRPILSQTSPNYKFIHLIKM